ncbi:hypothetical protein SODALDRAFT_347439 [Sodiomyces alkalinus F11]|uniref:GPI-anchored wall transfer protein 1 n=1 Tax=Sodiomyces alkalinus (strain CBS 110278 / VKM F-3762 / F11) TaxID=1314773 RepID=A0A3N2Q6N9_SODAK|nr:hypothetical protein SODALDRAFT_347439 [Sodiomyces alkalinus F11]ROT42459.1 hypothetical protein SODALDRAFT_347439 [Sodiomyces alkalinus F11]
MTGSNAADAAITAADYKKLKEDFVSNLPGGSIAEINYATAMAPSRQSLFKADTPFSLLVDYLLNIAPILVSVTLYTNSPLLLNTLLLLTTLLVYTLPRNIGAPRKKPIAPPPKDTRTRKDAPAGPPAALPPKPFLTNYRGGILVITTIAILAVNFPVRTWGDGLSVSRRLANLPYVFWVAAFNSAYILAYCLIETLFFPAVVYSSTAAAERDAYRTATSRVLHAYNRNGLAIFLLANLLTGLVNLTVPTLDVGPVAAMAILMAYTGTLTATALVLDAYDISLKL